MKKKPSMYQKSSYNLQFGDGSRGMCAASELHLDDGQLRDCLNLWYVGKELTSRPGIRYQGSILNGASLDYTPVEVSDYCLLSEVVVKSTGQVEEQDYGFYILYLSSSGETLSVGAYCAKGTHANQMRNVSGAAAVVGNKDGAFAIGKRRGMSFDFTGADGEARTKFCDAVTLFCGNRVLELKKSVSAVTSGSVGFSDVEPYAPLVMINRSPNGENSDYVDGYNQIGRRWRESFTTSGNFTFQLSHKNINPAAEHIITYTYYNGGYQEAVFTIPASVGTAPHMGRSNTVTLSGPMFKNETHNVFILLFYRYGFFWVCESTKENGNPDDYLGFTLPRGMDGTATNNLVIETESAEDLGELRSVISDCVDCAWFGGETHSLGGGGHLFVAGNRKSPDLVYYSSPSFPNRYFPEDYNIAVGDPGEPIVAMAKQSSALIVFKRNSTYAITYHGFASRLGPDGKEREHPQYTCTCINDSIGCWSKGSIQLINNHLVWLGTGNKIYLLRSLSQYSTASIRELSMNIEAVMDGIPAPIPDTAQDSVYPRILTASFNYNGYYILVSGREAWAWNWRLTPYPDTSNTEKAQRSLAWYRFSFPISFTMGACGLDGEPVLFSADQAFLMDINCHSDLLLSDGDTTEMGYQKRYVSKRYDLGEPYALKALSGMTMSLSGDTKAAVDVTGQFDDSNVPVATLYPESRESRLDKAFRLFPQRKPVRRVGITIESGEAGRMSLNESPAATLTLLGGIH